MGVNKGIYAMSRWFLPSLWANSAGL